MATYDRLSAQDRSFLDMEAPTAHMHVGGVFVFDKGPLSTPDGQLDFDKIQAFLESRLHRIPRYRQRIVKIPFENNAAAGPIHLMMGRSM